MRARAGGWVVKAVAKELATAEGGGRALCGLAGRADERAVGRVVEPAGEWPAGGRAAS